MIATRRRTRRTARPALVAPNDDHGLDAAHVAAFVLGRVALAAEHRRIASTIDTLVLSAKR
jgi:hypothetical protein